MVVGEGERISNRGYTSGVVGLFKRLSNGFYCFGWSMKPLQQTHFGQPLHGGNISALLQQSNHRD